MRKRMTQGVLFIPAGISLFGLWAFCFAIKSAPGVDLPFGGAGEFTGAVSVQGGTSLALDRRRISGHSQSCRVF
jgi:hypothetical protein